MKLLSLTLMCAFICATTAAPTASDSIVPETGLLQVAVDAKHTVETMLVAGSDSSACEDLADAIISEAESAVSHEQEILKTFPDGSECSTEGQAILDAAQTHLTMCLEKKASAAAAANTAASAPVDLGTMSHSSLGDSPTCVNLQNNPSIIAAKKASDDANAAAITADAELTAAQNSLVDAQAEQKAANKPCQCTAYQNYEIAYEKAKTASEEQLVAWKKGKHMHCVLAGTDPSSCSMDGAPEVTKRTLAEGVDQSACTSAPTPSPTRSPTPPHTPAPTTAAPTPDAKLASAVAACENAWGKGRCTIHRGCNGTPDSASSCGQVIVGVDNMNTATCNGHQIYAWCLNNLPGCGCGWPAARVSSDNGQTWDANPLGNRL